MRSPEAVLTKCFSWKTKYILMELVAFVLSTCESRQPGQVCSVKKFHIYDEKLEVKKTLEKSGTQYRLAK